VPRPQPVLADRKATSRSIPGAVAIIPARLQSTRLPEKPLQDLGGAPLVVRVLEQVRGSAAVQGVYVATDSKRIADAVTEAGGEVILTSPAHPTGLDRVAEATRLLREAPDQDPESVVLNVQGDEPFVSRAGLVALIGLFAKPEVRMATLAAPFDSLAQVVDPNRVKVLLDRNGRALYFSRAPIPSGYGPDAEPLHHVGVYGYRRQTLLDLAALGPAPIERAERLEQLRALWNGIPIHVAVGDYCSIGIDTPEDLYRARTYWGEGRSTT
jgi:3-deoxy-manno-octulosonate cytidylyltransferase (CMP-KDO synthetase)